MTAAANDDFLSGESGHVAGIRHTTRALAADAFAWTVAAARRQRPRLAHAADSLPRRRVLVLAIERLDVPNLLAAARAELLRSRHEVRVEIAPVGERGKFENLNRLLEAHPAEGSDWLLLLDDDVALPTGFLDAFLFLAERFELRIAQPAHRGRSHAAWRVTRRRVRSVARETGFVEIGPLTALHRSTFGALLPFPPLRAGWGLDLHWAAIARERGWKIGVIDATPIGHSLRPVAASYAHRAAIEEARAFLASRRYVPAAEAQQTLAEHRSWR